MWEESAQGESVTSIGKRTINNEMGSKLGQNVKSNTFGEGGMEAMATHRRPSIG